MEFIEYPVSAVMKLWHMALTALGMQDAPAWTLSIVLLVVTIRLILLPFAYRAYRSTRLLVNLRPAMTALDAEYADRFSAADRKELLQKRRDLQKSHGYRVRDGCIPILIQFPFFIGLYRILLQVARPANLEASTFPGVGVLSGEDVAHFLEAEIFGIPLSAYVAMPDSQFTLLGTDGSDVLRFALPLCIAAAVFTSLNMAYSIYRNWMTLDENNGTARGLFKIMFVLAAVAVAVPLLFGLLGPAPVAILCYWVMNNLWTMVQNVSLHVILDRQVPYTDEFRDHRREVGEARKARHREIREARDGLKQRSGDRAARIRELDRTIKRSSVDSVRTDAASEREALLDEDALDHETVEEFTNREKREQEERKRARREAQRADRQARAERAAAKKAGASEEPEGAEDGEASPEDNDPSSAGSTQVADAGASTGSPGEPASPRTIDDETAPYRGRHRLGN